MSFSYGASNACVPTNQINLPNPPPAEWDLLLVEAPAPSPGEHGMFWVTHTAATRSLRIAGLHNSIGVYLVVLPAWAACPCSKVDQHWPLPSGVLSCLIAVFDTPGKFLSSWTAILHTQPANFLQSAVSQFQECQNIFSQTDAR